MSKEKNTEKLIVVIIGIAVAIYACLYAGFCVYLYNDIQHPFMLLYGAIPIALLIGIIIVVKMRLKEISKGELDEAKKY